MPENDMIGIKYIESLYVIKKGRKFNVTAVAITMDGKKIGSSMYVSKNDVQKIYESYDSNIDEKKIDTTISSGPFKLLKYVIPSREEGMVPMYSIEIGKFKCRMLPSAFEEFAITLKASLEGRPSFSIRTLGRKKKKGLFE